MRKKLDAFQKNNKTRRLKATPAKKIGAKESSDSDSSDEEAVEKTPIRSLANVGTKRAAVQKKQASNSSYSDSFIFCEAMDSAQNTYTQKGPSGCMKSSIKTGLVSDTSSTSDKKNRITKYNKNYGSLELTGYHSQSAKKEAASAIKGKMSRAASKSAEHDSYIVLDEDSDGYSSGRIESNLEKTEERMNSVKTVPLDGMNELNADAPTVELKQNKEPRLKDILTGEMLRKRNRTAFTSDGKNRILKYKSNDGSLKLAGTNNCSTKLKVGKDGKVKKNSAPQSTDCDSHVKLNEKCDALSSKRFEFNLDNKIHSGEIGKCTNSEKTDASQRNPEFGPEMFNKAISRKLDAFWKNNKTRRLQGRPSKKIGAEESSDSDSSDEEAVEKTPIRNPVDVGTKRAADQMKQVDEAGSDSDSVIFVKKWTPPKPVVIYLSSSSSSED